MTLPTESQSAIHILRATWRHQDDSATWLEIVFDALFAHQGMPVSLAELYELIEMHPKTMSEKRWKKLVRATLAENEGFVPVAEGMWGLRTWRY
jgi:DNA-directed RNA polymerase delta subunit